MTRTAQFRHTGAALTHPFSPRTWRKSFTIRPADAIFAPAIKVGIAATLVLVPGGLLGQEQLAGIAALGALISAYGRYQPYRRLAVLLVVVAAAMLLTTGIGALMGAGQASIGLQIVILSVIAALAAHVFAAFRISGPGAVILIFAAAAASSYAGTVDAVPLALSAMAIGVVVGWLVAMAPVLVFPMGPARLAVARAIASVIRAGTDNPAGKHDGGSHPAAARAAALAAVGAARESVAVSAGPLRGRNTRSLRLRHYGAELNLLLDEAGSVLELLASTGRDGASGALDSLARHEAELRKVRHDWPAAATRATGETAQAGAPTPQQTQPPGLLAAVRAGLLSRTSVSQALRIAGASVLSGWVAAGLGFDHPLWASMGAVAALQGLNYTMTVQRGIQRLAGNVLGAALAVALLSLSLGFWPSVAMVIVFQVLAEMLVLKNYILTTIAVTPMALIMTGLGSRLGPEAAFSRVADTLVGVVIGVLVAALSISLADRHHLPSGEYGS